MTGPEIKTTTNTAATTATTIEKLRPRSDRDLRRCPSFTVSGFSLEYFIFSRRQYECGDIISFFPRIRPFYWIIYSTPSLIRREPREKLVTKKKILIKIKEFIYIFFFRLNENLDLSAFSCFFPTSVYCIHVIIYRLLTSARIYINSPEQLWIARIINYTSR